MILRLVNENYSHVLKSKDWNKSHCFSSFVICWIQYGLLSEEVIMELWNNHNKCYSYALEQKRTLRFWVIASPDSPMIMLFVDLVYDLSRDLAMFAHSISSDIQYFLIFNMFCLISSDVQYLLCSISSDIQYLLMFNIFWCSISSDIQYLLMFNSFWYSISSDVQHLLIFMAIITQPTPDLTYL